MSPLIPQQQIFGSRWVRAPGRVNLIGEHTDYNGGFVLPAAIDLELLLEFEPTNDGIVHIESQLAGERQQFALDAIGPRRGSWVDYVAGVATILRAEGLPAGSFSGRLSGDLPAQAGLSSSAALELACGRALLQCGGASAESMEPMALARLCQRAENSYVGVNSGLMDQFAVACGVAGHALLLDCRSLDWRPVAIPGSLELVIVETGARRRLVGSEYNERRAQCEQGVAILAGRGTAVASLRDVTLPMLDEAKAALGELVYRRCRHVVEENSRAVAAADALEAGDLPTLGDLFAASHRSLRDLYDVSSPALDAAVEIADKTAGVVGARMTGAGFGGCTINLVEKGAANRLRAAIDRDYTSATGLKASVYEVRAVAGAGIVGS